MTSSYETLGLTKKDWGDCGVVFKRMRKISTFVNEHFKNDYDSADDEMIRQLENDMRWMEEMISIKRSICRTKTKLDSEIKELKILKLKIKNSNEELDDLAKGLKKCYEEYQC